MGLRSYFVRAHVFIPHHFTILLKFVLFFFTFLLTVHLSTVISVIKQLDAQKFCFTVSLFHASTCFEHMCSKHVEA